MTAPDDLASWLLAQIDEDERKARTAAGQHVAWTADLMPSVLSAVTRHARRDLLDCQAKRRIVELHAAVTDSYLDPIGWCGVDAPPADGRACRTCGTWTEYAVAFPCMTLRLLSLAFADRPGYQERWRP